MGSRSHVIREGPLPAGRHINRTRIDSYKDLAESASKVQSLEPPT
jgi:hypothetical protein